MFLHLPGRIALCLLTLGAVARAEIPPTRRFELAGLVSAVFSPEVGHGFEPGAELSAKEVSGCVTAARPFSFSLAVPEGNYQVRVVLGGHPDGSVATVKAESRRLVIEAARVAAGAREERRFSVNVRTPALAVTPDVSGARPVPSVSLKERELGVRHWDEKLTLEFLGERPTVCTVEVTADESAPTVYIAGDSTVTDQPKEPYASWGQMLPRFLSPEVVVANHAESGESLKSFIASRRLAKVLSRMRTGDYLFIEFGHNDQKPASPGTYVEPHGTYPAYLRVFIAEARQRGAVPVLLTSIQRRQFQEDGTIRNSHGDYPQAVREVAKQEDVALIDLDLMSRGFYEALGPEKALLAFADGGRDATHHGDYGAYQLAKCVVQGIRDARLGLARFVVADFAGFDPRRPDPVDSFRLAASGDAPGPVPEGR